MSINNDVYVINEQIIELQTEDAMILRCDNELLYLGQFEVELIKLFDGISTLEDISNRLIVQYPDTYIEKQFYTFIEKLKSLKVLINEERI